ncbi:vef [Mamestra brassicae multiple nucleopolyhedrovirus]|uniref:Vef n=1 Tax=Mamestra brassicae nuclear polyhedrosis virus TaxID=78219 RepID=I3XM97_NPVMB|nr:vef [Mamestra brassicae multiple nucleopolyhedrovirus]AFL64930.1 vef [Mamestra brassicae multiple nucleopolyhedrovirus]WRQ96653.1 vef [Mamestra configurata nucleopolyhedrovirus B]
MSNLTIPIPVLKAPSYINSGNSYYALHHYKEPIPFLIKSGSVVKLSTNHQCTILVYNNNRLTERTIENMNSNTTLNIEVDSVVFINNMIVSNPDDKYRVTYSIDGDHEPLTRINMGNNEYSDGVNETLSYVFVEGKWIQLLVPQTDLKHLNGMIANDKNLDELNDYYSSIIEFYNDLTSTDFVRKYFAKADNSGVGGAYYGKYTMGESSPSMRRFYLTPSKFNWGCLHEIAHSFDAHFTSNYIHADIREVWTNIMPDYYQYLNYTEEEYLTRGWKYDGRRDAVLIEIKRIFDVIPFNKWSLRQRLVFLTSFFFKLGHKKLMSALFMDMRQQINNGTFDSCSFKTMERIMTMYDRNNMDIVHINRLVGINELDALLTLNIKHNMQNSVFVFDFMIRPSIVNFELIDSDLGIQRDVNLTFKNANPIDLIGAHYSLVKNTKNILESTFTNVTSQIFTNVRLGAYKFFYVTGNSTRRYYCDTEYVVFGETEPTRALTIMPLLKPVLYNETFNFRGLGDHLAGTLEINYQNEYVYFTPISYDPHVYFPNDIYYSVNIKNHKLFEYFGVDNDIDTLEYKFPLVYGQEIVLYHREIGRLISAFNTTNRTNTFTITPMGVRQGDTNQSSRIVEKILHFCLFVTERYPNLIASPYVQNEVYLSAFYLLPQDQNNLIPLIAHFLPDTQVTSMTLMGINYTNLVTINEKNGVLQLRTFNNNAPGLEVILNLVRNQGLIYNLLIDIDSIVEESEYTVALEANDVLHIVMNNMANTRFIVINGVLEQSNNTAVSYRWNNNTFNKISDDSNVNFIPTPLLWALGILFSIIIILLIIIIKITLPNAKETIIKEKSKTNIKSIK